MKSGKSPGPDGIPAEALKANLAVSLEMLHPLFTKVWEEGIIPSDWKEGHLIKLPKKGDLGQCTNYRGITLLSIPGKVFNRILLNRMKDAVECFTYLGSNVDKMGGSDADVKIRIGKARTAFHQLNNVWASSNIAQS